MTAPHKAPKTLLRKDPKKNRDNRDINKTEPQVKNNVLWKPINKSVIKKLNKTINIDLFPKIAGT